MAAALYNEGAVEPLGQLSVLIVDCQTTGASPALGAVLEIGWGVARAEGDGVADLQAHWVTLPAGTVVASPVRRLTGFDPVVVESAGTMDPPEVWQRLRASMSHAAPAPAAIHFARFELAFLRDWAARFEPETTFPLDAVCLHAVACRLYPDLPRRSIRALAGYLGHGVDLTRRCLGHVEATAFIWRKLAGELAGRGIQTWDELRAWLETPAPARARKRRYPLPSARYRVLPDQPGVYRFLRCNGDLLYVGKAASLRKRVASHFTTRSAITERALEMLTQVHDVEVTPTCSALEAALLENEEIKGRNPPYNVQLVAGDPRTWFCTRACDAAAPAVDEVHRCGPLPSRFAVLALGAVRALLAGDSGTPTLRARAVGAALWWAPDEEVFEAGLAAFVARHGLAGGSPWEALAAAARLILERGEVADPEQADVERDDDPRRWDPERVVRHLERGVAQAHQLLERARWLCLLHDSAVAFREPGSERTRLLRVAAGQVVEARDLAPGESIPVPGRSLPLRERQAAFDRSGYDRLRTLTSELKRILRDGGQVVVGLGRGHRLRPQALLRWV
jgi:DNA polymerase-3 subunit epsilon